MTPDILLEAPGEGEKLLQNDFNRTKKISRDNGKVSTEKRAFLIMNLRNKKTIVDH